MKTLTVRVMRCVHCGHPFDGVTVLGGTLRPPRAGDASVCFACGEVMRFDRRNRVRRMSAREIATLSPDLAAALHATQAVVRRFLAAQESDP